MSVASGSLEAMSLFPGGSISDPWFRVGRVPITTVMAVVVAVVASWLAWVIAPGLPSLLAYSPSLVASGEVWRVVTWPLANGLSLWGILNLFFFWYFGTELEAEIGRASMVRFLVGVWASLTVAATLVSLVLGGVGLAGIGLVQFVVLLVWIADNPRRPFFFNIPAWVIGVVLVGLQVLSLIAARATANLLSLLLSLVLVAMVARAVGLLSSFAWIPGGRTSRPARRPRAAKGPDRQTRQREADRARLDELLDLINERGINGLTEGQRKELLALRERMRRP